jgi:outer membrane receptor protein involved in Fe transport
MMARSARLLGVLAFLGAVVPLSAQTTGSIRGTVETGGTPLPGVTVEARSPNLQGSRSAVTDGDGRFNLTLLPPGAYTVTATLDGFAPKAQTLQLGLGQAVVLNVELLQAQSEEVTVTAQAATVETESNTVGRNMDAATFQALPTGRNYASVVQLASGVNTDNSDVRQTSITVYGATGLENAYMVDGANTTGVEIGSQGKVLNFEFIQEVELKAGGYEAEYTGAQGGILNVVTKSGGNEFHGDAFGYWDDDNFQAENKHLDEITAEGIPVGFTRSDYGADIGGYVLKDRLWFFGAYDHVDNTFQRQITQGPADVIGTITDLDTTSNLYAGKLTWTLSPSHTLIGTVFGDPTEDVGAVAPVLGPPTTYLGTVTVGGTDFGGRYQGTLSANFLLTGQFGYHRENVDTLPAPGGNIIPYVDNRGEFQVATGGFLGPGGEGQFALKDFTRYDYILDGTYFLGSHELKAGFGFQRIDADVIRDTSGGQIVEILDPLEDDPLQRTVYTHTFFAGLDATPEDPTIAPVVATPQNDVLAAFVQDRWQVLPNLTVNAGVRWEQQLIRGLDDLTYINIDHFSPRVGFTWDFMNNGRTKAYASYSQFVPLIPMDMNVRSLNGERDGFTTNFDPVDLACDTEFFGEDDCVIRGTAVDDIDPNLKSPYSEEILAGVEWQATNEWVVGLRGIYRALGRVLEDTYVADLDNYVFFNPGDSVLAPEFAPGRRYFRGIEVTGQKRLADNWMLYASYMYSSLKGNFDGSFRAIGGFFARNPFITDDFDYPEFQVNAYGNLTLDRPHQAKLQTAYVFPFGLTMSASAYYQSGTPLSRIGWWDAYIGPELFITTRGSEGRSPDTYEMDLQADYGLRLGPVTVHVLASLFNVLNRQQVTQVDQVWAFQEDENDLPEPTNENYGNGNQWQQPRTLRLGLRVSF